MALRDLPWKSHGSVVHGIHTHIYITVHRISLHFHRLPLTAAVHGNSTDFHGISLHFQLPSWTSAVHPSLIQVDGIFTDEISMKNICTVHLFKLDSHNNKNVTRVCVCITNIFDSPVGKRFGVAAGQEAPSPVLEPALEYAWEWGCRMMCFRAQPFNDTDPFLHKSSWR